MLGKARQYLQRFWGYQDFRPAQVPIIRSILEGQDTLVLMPTGGGKSLCYQIPALVRPGTAIVVSPLIALMQDQVQALRANGIPAVFLNSSLTDEERLSITNHVRQGKMKLLYVSPEKLLTSSFLSLIHQLEADHGLSLFAIDEAHCISQWGHDFRPEYTQLSQLKKRFVKVPMIALTATADRLTRQDILKQLALESPKVFVSSFDRPNLSLTVRPGRKRIDQMVEFIKSRRGQSGIVYCLSRKSTQKVAEALGKQGIKATFYHAGLSSSQRQERQRAFVNDDIGIVCATVAFGMGIDKPNVRWVIHYNMPKNMEGYYQEIGRAGRDGLASDTLLFYSVADVMVLRRFISDNDREGIELAKLQRMQQYATASSCRRRVLLSYFGEVLDEDCKNCDVCLSSVEKVDGTSLSRMVLFVVAKLGQRVGKKVVIDILRGAESSKVVSHNWQALPVFGRGREVSEVAWDFYLNQLIDLGYLEVAYDNYGVLKLSKIAQEVLEGKSSVALVPYRVKQRFDVSKKDRGLSASELVDFELMEGLKALRKQLAQKAKVPPYMIFQDVTLQQLVDSKPLVWSDLVEISGMGLKKRKQYGDMFLHFIRRFAILKLEKGEKFKGGSHLYSAYLYEQGLSIAEIARKRSLRDGTVVSHLVTLYERGYDLDLGRDIDSNIWDRVIEVIDGRVDALSLKDIYTTLGQSVDYTVIRLVLAWVRNQQKQVA